jgi:hypothetical protein
MFPAYSRTESFYSSEIGAYTVRIKADRCISPWQEALESQEVNASGSRVEAMTIHGQNLLIDLPNAEITYPVEFSQIFAAFASASLANFWVKAGVVASPLISSVWATQVLASYMTQGRKFFAEQMSSLITEEKDNRLVGPQVTELGRCHREFCDRMNIIINPSSACEFSDAFCNDISEIIYRYDHCIDHVPEVVSDLFFNYSNLLESVLLVINKRHLDISSVKDVLAELESIYREIHLCIISSKCDYINSLNIRLNNLEEKMVNDGLMPTVDECEEEIEETFASMNDEEKEDLARLLRN